MLFKVLLTCVLLNGCAIIRASPNTGVERITVMCLFNFGPCFDAADTRTDVEEVEEMDVTTQ